MAAPSYATDLTSILADMASSTGWTLISSGGGGANSFTVPETDDYIQGSNCISRNPWSSSIRGMVYNSSQTFTSGQCLYIWWKADVAQSLAAEASGGVQILIGSGTGDLDCFYVAGSDTYLIGGWRVAVIDPTATPSTSIGTPSGTTSYFGVRWNVPSSGPSKGYPFKIDAFRRGRGTVTITNGDSSTPATWARLTTETDSGTNRYGMTQATDTGATLAGVVSWGSASTSCYSRDSGKAIVLLNTKGFVPTDHTQVLIQHASTDLEWDNISFLSLDTANRGLLSISNNAKAWLTNCSFSGLNTIDGGGSNTKFDGSTFRSCNAVTSIGGSYLGVNVLTPTVAADASAFVWNTTTDTDGKVDGSTFSIGTNAHHAIEFSQYASSYTLRDCVFTGFNASDGNNDSALYFPDTGSDQDWTVNLNGCTGDISYKKARSGDTVTLVFDTRTLTIEVRDTDGALITDTTEITLVRTSDVTVLHHAEDVTTGSTSYGYTYSSDTTCYVNVLSVVNYVPKTVEPVVLINSDQTVTVQLEDERGRYNNP
jgi:hypothetical protein